MNKQKMQDIAVIIPFYQRQKEPLINAIKSIGKQTYTGDIYIIVVDDGSPVSARDALSGIVTAKNHHLNIIEQKNGGAGSARNTGLNNVADHIPYVAFLDSDDAWRPRHLEDAIVALSKGYDLYFSDWTSYKFPGKTNFERTQTLLIENHKGIQDFDSVYELGMTPLEHILQDGGGVIGTSAVVYRFNRFSKLRFREEFYNGQDFFFLMDLGESGATTVFSTKIGFDAGQGINIYQSAGWGTEKSLQRARNELFVWTSVNRFYNLSSKLKHMNKKTIRNLQKGVIRDVFYRMRRRNVIPMNLIRDILVYDPFILMLIPWVIMIVVFERIRKTS